MLSTTFLGHQGWLFLSKSSCFLVDPLLCEEFGQAHALEYRVYPPRAFSFEQFPKVDGVVLTHEHDDHFDIPSLARLERTIAIFLSARSSTAARQLLRQMGFTVHPLIPGPEHGGRPQRHHWHLPNTCGDTDVRLRMYLRRRENLAESSRLLRRQCSRLPDDVSPIPARTVSCNASRSNVFNGGSPSEKGF